MDRHSPVDNAQRLDGGPDKPTNSADKADHQQGQQEAYRFGLRAARLARMASRALLVRWPGAGNSVRQHRAVHSKRRSKIQTWKRCRGGCFCSGPEVKINYDGPRTKEKMFADPRFSLRKGVAVQKSRIIRLRPMIPTGWSLTFVLEFDDSILNKKSLIKAIEDAGSLVGLGDWRPKFGRFNAEFAE